MGLPHTARSDSASSRSALQGQGGVSQGISAQAQLMECMLVGCFRAFQGPATAAAAVKLINGNKSTFLSFGLVVRQKRRHLKTSS